MIFKFVLYNHDAGGQRSLEDVTDILGNQMIALGHQAFRAAPEDTDFIGPADGYNVLVEGFTEPLVADIARCHALGARFLCIATEEPTANGFNHGYQEEMRRRQAIFPQAAKYFDGIIPLVAGEECSRWYSQHAPTAFSELGYSPTMVMKSDHIPTWDVGYYGSLTNRRMSVLKRLAKRLGSANPVRLVGDFAPQAERNKIMLDCKVLVQVRKYDKMALFSNSRACVAMNLGRPLVCESGHAPSEWSEIVPFADSEDDFFRRVMIARSMWRAMHAGQFEKFKTRMSPERCLGKALASLGIESPSRKEAA